MSQKPIQILKDVFGFDSFLPLQQEIINNVLGKRDTLAIMATGGGKSLCYQIPALIFEGLTIVVSPLISLMKDQVDGLREIGIPAIYLNSSLSIDDYQNYLSQALRGEVKLLYISPEALLNARLLSMLSTARIDCLTIDEAHCISQWGHDFRPEYRQLMDVRHKFPGAVCFALTATATPRVRQDILTCLEFNNEDEFIGSFNRKNLFLEVRPKGDGTTQTIEFIKGFPDQSGIVYCATRAQVDELGAALRSANISVLPYHAGMENRERQRAQEAFIHDEVQVIVATIAFGMGIDKPNVRFVLHYDLPQSMENYYQEIGRGGRDGLPTHCLLLYRYSDSGTIRYFINKLEDKEQKRIAYFHLDALINYAESADCRRIPLLMHFGEEFPQAHCDACDNCREREGEEERIDSTDITIPAQMFLSCVKRTGERFGASYVSDVLRGSKSQRVHKFNHQKLSTYGIGRDYSRAQWMHLSRIMIQKGLLSRETRSGGLKLTPKSYQFLKSEETLYGTVMEEIASAPAHGLQASELDYDRELFEKLRFKRKQLADQAGLPAFTIFNDRTLIEMATYFPHSMESMRNIYGVGVRKLDAYGRTFLEIITDHCQTHKLPERQKPGPEHRTPVHRQTRTRRHIQVGEAFIEGQSVEEIASELGIKEGTVLGHLGRFQREGHNIPMHRLLNLVKAPQEHQEIALRAFKELGTQFLSPVHDHLDGIISFDDLRILRLYYISQQPRAIDPS